VIQFARYPLPVVQCDSVLNDFFKVFEGKTVFNIDGDRDIQTLNQWVLKPAKWIEKLPKIFRTNQIHSRLWIKIKTEYLVFVDSNRLIDAQFKDDEIWYIIHPFAKTTRNTNRRHRRFPL
jgi:dephospho-CoA kinase